MGAAANFVAIQHVFKIRLIQFLAHFGSSDGWYKLKESWQAWYRVHLHTEVWHIAAVDNILRANIQADRGVNRQHQCVGALVVKAVFIFIIDTQDIVSGIQLVVYLAQFTVFTRVAKLPCKLVPGNFDVEVAFFLGSIGELLPCEETEYNQYGQHYRGCNSPDLLDGIVM